MIGTLIPRPVNLMQPAVSKRRSRLAVIEQHEGATMISRLALIPARLGAGVFLGAVLATTAGATHEVYHRYTVWGEVLYEDGTPLANETIHLTVRGGTPLVTIDTDEKGRYRLVLHVHDPDVNKVFDMTVRDVTQKIRLEFDPKDHETERGKRVDFEIKK